MQNYKYNKYNQKKTKRKVTYLFLDELDPASLKKMKKEIRQSCVTHAWKQQQHSSWRGQHFLMITPAEITRFRSIKMILVFILQIKFPVARNRVEVEITGPKRRPVSDF